MSADQAEAERPQPSMPPQFPQLRQVVPTLPSWAGPNPMIKVVGSEERVHLLHVLGLVRFHVSIHARPVPVRSTMVLVR